MRKLSFLFVGVFFLSIQAFGQNNLKRVQGVSLHPSDEVFVNEKGEYFARVFYIAFDKHVTEDIYQSQDISKSNIKIEHGALKNIFGELERDHGLEQMERLYPEAIPNDTIRYSKKGKRVIVSDLSNIYRLIFDDLKSLKFVKEKMSVSNVKYVEQPPIYYTTSNYPNDPYFDNQWTHKILESKKVFEITDGDPNIVIGISDAWTTNSSAGVHEDMNGRILAFEHGKWVPGQSSGASHGPRIALIAAATNNNNKGIASLGGNMKIVISGLAVGTNGVIPGLPYLRDICNELQKPPGCDEIPDIINMSWNGGNSSTTKAILQDLLNMGVILVTGAGNFGDPPRITYPSGYTFANDEQVISVTATQLTDDQGLFSQTVPLDPPFDPFQYEERFVFESYGTPDETFFNYSLDNDPISNPDSSFTDIAAPSMWIYTARGVTSTNDYGGNWGATSEAAPLVTSVIAMMLSVNPNLKGDPKKVYDILTSSTDYDNIVVPPNSVTFNHPDGIRKYNKYIGYGRVNAYKTVVAAIPKKNNDINSATTWSGYIHLENSVNVYDDLTILPGTTILMDDNVSLLIRPGAKLISEGTQADPIRFIRGDADNDWNRVTLLSSSGNSIKWTLFDGGYINLSIASKNNTIEHSTFRNATHRTIEGWHNQDGSGNASATISHSLIENSGSIGIVAQYLDLNLNNTTIQNNNQDGLYVHSSTVFPFYQNLITDNGQAVSSRDGARITSSGTFYMLGASYDEGYNEISDNAHNQIENYGDTIVGAALGGNGGYNSIKGNYSGSNYLVANYGSTINAVGTWWGQTTTDPAMFTGTVSGTHLTFDPTTSPGNDGESPAKTVFKEEIDFNQLFEEAEEALSNASNSDEIQNRFHHLYQLEGLANKPDITDRFQNLTILATQEIYTPFSNQSLTNTYKEIAVILYAKSLIRNEDYSEAESYIGQINSAELSEENKREFLDLRLVTETYHGKYEKALSTLDELYAQHQAKGENLEEVLSRYHPIREDILVRLKDNDRSSLKETTVKEDIQDQINEFALHQNYPNPFNPVTNISFTLPERGFVSLKVYDILGREVASLVNDVKSIGTHSVNFDASFLSSGIYMYKLEVGQKVFSKRMTLIK